MPGSATTQGRGGARVHASLRVAFRHLYGVGALNSNTFAAQWLACLFPDRRFASTLAGGDARLGANVDCYAFIAVDFHHLLLAGLPAHTDLFSEP